MKNKKYYAIKVGNGVENLITETWEECKKYVINYPAIFKSFKSQKEAKRYLKSFSDEDIKYYLMRNEINRYYRLKEKIQMKYNFKIPDYILDEMINGKKNNLCYLINLAVMNNRLSKENAQILKDRECK